MKKSFLFLMASLYMYFSLTAQTIENVQIPIPIYVTTGSTPNDPGEYEFEEVENKLQGVNIFMLPRELVTLFMQSDNVRLAFNTLTTGVYFSKLEVDYDNSGWTSLYDGTQKESHGWIEPPGSFQSLGGHNLKVRYFNPAAGAWRYREYNVVMTPAVDEFHRDGHRTYTQSGNLLTTGNQIYLYDNNECPNADPVLVVEGFDPANTTFPEFYMFRGGYLRTRLQELGYKVYVLNFNLNAQSMVNNAAVVSSAIEYISSLNNNKNVLLIGASMGGVISRFATAQAEDAESPLSVSALITMDAPHQGAVIDANLQDFLHEENESLAEGILGTPAARQLLKFNAFDPFGSSRSSFMDLLNSFNDDVGYPVDIPVIGVAHSTDDPNPASINDKWLSIGTEEFFIDSETAVAGSFLSPAFTNIDPIVLIRWIPWFQASINRTEKHPTFVSHTSALDLDGNGASAMPFAITSSVASSWHDVIPDNVVVSIELIFRNFTPDIIFANKTYNYSSFIGEHIRRDIDVYGTLLSNEGGFSGFQDDPFQGSNQTSYTLSTNSCDPVTVTVYNDGLFEVGNGSGRTSDVIFNPQSILIIQSGGIGRVKANSKIVIADEAMLDIESGGKLELENGAQVILKAGSEMRVESGATLKISDNSALIIEEDAILIIEDGAIIQLEDGLSPDGDARIEVRGNLYIQGDINLSGNGFFDFYEGHTISITPTTFELTGYAPNYRLIRVNNTILNLTQNHIKFNEFKIELVGSGSVHTGNNKNVGMNGINYIGIDHSTTGLFVDRHRRIHVQDSRFEDLNNGLAIHANTGGFPGYHTVIDRTDFISNNTGVIINEMDQAYVRHCNFEGNAEGVLIGQINQIYFLSTDFSANTKGIEVWGDEQAQRIVVDNSYFFQNEYGLFSYGGGKFNLILKNGTTLEENNVGVRMLGAGMDPYVLDYGILIMDCAKLINNEIGIQGTDVVLMIDAYTASHTDDPDYVRSNHFESDPANQLLFDICYDIRTLSNMTPIPARGNYWSFTVPVSGTTFPWKMRQCSGPLQSAQNPFIYTGFTEEEPEGCPSRLIDIDVEFEDCILFQGTIEEIDIAAEYFEGMKDWREQIDSMAYNESGDWYAHFETIYSYDPLDTTMTDVCKYYIYTSGAFATGSLSFGNKPYHGLNNPELENNTFDIYPNPFDSNEPVYLSYNSGASLEMELLNVQGTVVFKQTLALSESLTTLKFPDLPAGVYVLKYMDMESGESGYQILTKL